MKNWDSLGRSCISRFAGCPEEHWEVCSVPSPPVSGKEGITEHLSSFLISFKKQERWRWALQCGGRGRPWERELWLAQPQSTIPGSQASFHCDPKKDPIHSVILWKWADSGNPPPKNVRHCSLVEDDPLIV